MARIIVKSGPDGGQVHRLEEQPVSIGREADNTIQLLDGGVSRHHATIVFERGAYYISDLASANGTKVQGKRIERALLKDGDEIAMGASELLFEEGGALVQSHADVERKRSVLVLVVAGLVVALLAGGLIFGLFWYLNKPQ